MSKAEKVIKFYVLCNRLKDVIRSGWKVWHVKRERLESVAEHVYGAQMLAIAMWAEYSYDIDLEKVVVMLALHELEEALIGDVIPFDASVEEKKKLGRKMVGEMLSDLGENEVVRDLTEEYYEQKTAEARFVMECDKLEADLQCKIYDEEGWIDLAEQEGNAMLADAKVQEFAQGKTSAAEVWLEYNRWKNDYDRNFLEVSNFAQENRISQE